VELEELVIKPTQNKKPLVFDIKVLGDARYTVCPPPRGLS